jgi:hypothetical protein
MLWKKKAAEILRSYGKKREAECWSYRFNPNGGLPLS